MPSVKNPNKMSRNRVAARAATQRKKQKMRSADGKLGGAAGKAARADTKRGARAGLLPTSGPRKQLSAKKEKKVIQRLTLTLKRKMAANGGVLPAEYAEYAYLFDDAAAAADADTEIAEVVEDVEGEAAAAEGEAMETN